MRKEVRALLCQELFVKHHVDAPSHGSALDMRSRWQLPSALGGNGVFPGGVAVALTVSLTRPKYKMVPSDCQLCEELCFIKINLLFLAMTVMSA